MSADRFVIVHTEELGHAFLLGNIVYTDRGEAEQRAGERQAAADEHGWPDRYEVCRLMPADAEPRVMSWDYNEQPDSDELARHLNAGLVHLHDVGDTGGQDYAWVLSSTPLDEGQVAEAWHRHWAGDAT